MRWTIWSTISFACLVALAWPAPARAGTEKDTRTWRQRSSTGPANPFAIMAYAGQGKMILLGGDTTWHYDVNAGTWTMHKPTPTPSYRTNYGLAYDTRRQRVVLFGGDTGTQYTNELWEYDATTVQWRKLTTSGPSPSPRRLPLWAYDEKRGVFVAQGGYARDGQSDSTRMRDTWEWDGSVWTQKSMTSVGVEDARFAFYHPGRGTVVALDQRGGPSEWDGNKWAFLNHTNVDLPVGAGMAYAGNGRMIAFGGVENWSANSNATWESDGKAWYRITTTAAPSARSVPLLAYDPDGGRLVMTGGAQYFFDDKTPTIFLRDTWEYQVTALDTGSPCDPAHADQCTSKLCVHGVCCVSACTGACESCAVAGKEGQCMPTVTVTPACPAPSPGTGGSGPAPSPDAAAGTGGSGGMSETGTGGAPATGAGGAPAPVDARPFVDSPAADGAPAPSGSGGSDARAPDNQPITPRRGHYAGPACAFVSTASESASPAVWLLVALLVAWRRRQRRR